MTPQAQTRVADAQARLASAERDMQTAQIATAKEQLQEIRCEGQGLKTELESLVSQVKTLDSADIALARGDLGTHADAIAAHLTSKPDPAEFPTDDELLAWQTELIGLETAQRDASELVNDLARRRAVLVQRAVDLDARLGRLRNQQRNLECLVRGEPVGVGWQGGVRGV